MLVASGSANGVLLVVRLRAACVGEPKAHAWVRRMRSVNATNKTLAAQWGQIGLNDASGIAIKRNAFVQVREPLIGGALDVRLACINRSIRRRRGTTTTNQQRSNQHVTHHAIVHANADTCAAIGKAVWS